MDVILSWSGSQSRIVAETLRTWLLEVLPGVSPWISSEDITKGSSWFSALLGRLEAANICIICITPENIMSPWLHFEAGAIAGKGSGTRICSYLIGVKPTSLSAPLSQFQATVANRSDTWKLVRDINRHLKSGVHNEQLLETNFHQKWPQLKGLLDAVVAQSQTGAVSAASTADQVRPLYQLSQEAVELLMAAAEDPSGSVLAIRTFDGFHVETNRSSFATLGDARSAAIWQGAIRQLLQDGLLENRGNRGEVFGVTAEGYRVADELRSLKPEQPQQR